MPVIEPHGLGQCWCGQYHLTATWAPVTLGINPVVTTTLRTWQPVADPSNALTPERITSYEGRHRSE